jgi:chemotaxis protein CheD
MTFALPERPRPVGPQHLGATATRAPGSASDAFGAPSATPIATASAAERPVDVARDEHPLLVAGIGDMVVTDDPAAGLVAYGLGSCVALAAWDPATMTAGLAHFMLPTGTSGGGPVKFVDRGLPAFLAAFEARGGSTRRARFKLAGGAAMLAIHTSSLGIGRRNAEAVQSAMATLGLTTTATDLGGTVGRTVQLDASDGRLHIRSVGRTSVI